MSTPATAKIAKVAGQTFGPIPIDTDNETIRQLLVSQGFADVAAAEIKTTRDGEREVIEFVKKAGTKGAELTGPALAALLARVPPAPPAAVLPGLTARQSLLIQRLRNGELSIDTALGDEVGQAIADATTHDGSRAPDTQGGRLCQACSALPATAVAPSGW